MLSRRLLLCSVLIAASWALSAQQAIPVSVEAAGEATGGSLEREPAGNVNSRYRVESVLLSRGITKRISRALRHDIDSLVGQHFDPQSVANLALRIRSEVRVVVKHRLEKGDQPDYVRVVYEARERRWDEDSAQVTKLNYHQKLGPTAGVQLGFDAGRNNRIEAGAQTDADSLLERLTGYNLSFSRQFGDRVRLRFEFEGLDARWNPATQTALLSRADVPGVYRNRYRMDPAIVVLLAPGLSLTSGLSFQRFRIQVPEARYEASNAAFTTLRHTRQWSTGPALDHRWDASYGLRVAAANLDSDFAYVRHQFEMRYAAHSGSHRLSLRAGSGYAGDEAPLFERFTLGDSRTLRGWSKFDVAPLGGTRMAHASLQYTWRRVGAFYDTGSVWDRRTPSREKHAAGALLTLNSAQEGPFIAVGFPIRSGNVTPLFILGMTF